MILYFNGDSFTHGAELWEEKHVLNYASLSPSAARMAGMYKPEVSDLMKDLTYTGRFKEKYPEHVIINDSYTGSSQMAIASRAINSLHKLRKENPNEKIVCVIQNTSAQRIFVKDLTQEQYRNYSINNLKHCHQSGESKGLQMQEFILEHYPHQRLVFEYFAIQQSIKYYCSKLNIDFFHWCVWPIPEEIIKTGELNLKYMAKDFFDDRYTYPGDLLSEMENEAKLANEPLELPGHHWRIKWHQVLADKIDNFLKSKNVL
jgi:hypothetical protein